MSVQEEKQEERTNLEIALGPTLPGDFPDSPVSRRRVPPMLAQRYEDIRYLGEGGMGTVYRALDPRLGRTVAVKLLKGDDPELWRRFLAEARAQARIQHENVVRVYEAGQVDGEPYIAMQFIDGEPLSKAKEKLPLEQRMKVMQEISAAVHEAHRLGIIHRDIKPSNILCERREDGTIKPYIMDFGLAREVEDKGQTQTGAVLGTPAYMPPEQARGDVRSMDRRSDVYSLGATLYDLIADRPPFVSDHAWNLLMAVAYEEAPLLSKVKKGVPEDLETIVMQCLEREPSHRYESARALSEDLQRYLDGDPILAKRAFIGYVLWKKAKKHKLMATFLVSLFVGSLVLAGFWVRARRQAAEQALLAQELGEGVKEMELFLRAAYELPLHDVERERDVVRGRLLEIEQRMGLAGKAGEGPGHYAIGRGYLALGDPGQAREHLEKAFLAGYVSADLQYALGRAFGELFRRAVDETKRITNEEERKKKVEELEKSLRDPALKHLRAAVSAKIEVPAYAEGLIALYEGKNEEALAKAKEASGKAPWMYEAKKLEGDALFAEGSKYRHDAAFDYEKMKGYFEPAGKAYEIAADMGRSDPEVHRAACELWEKMGQGAWMKGVPFTVPYDAAIQACEHAVKSSTRDGKARIQRALVLSSRIYVTDDDAISEETLKLAEKALKAARDSVEASANDVMAHYAMASALYEHAHVLMTLGRDANMTKAIEAYERVITLDNRFVWAFNELGDALLAQVNNDLLHGRDVTDTLHKAIMYFDKAVEIDPKFALPAGRRLNAYRLLVEYDVNSGRDTTNTIKSLFDAVSHLETTGSGPWLVAFWKSRAFRLRASYELATGRDPRESTKIAIDVLHAFAGPAISDYWFLVELAECQIINARYAVYENLNAETSIQVAREAAQKAADFKKPMSPESRLLLARIEAVAIRAARRSEKLEATQFSLALDLLAPLLSEKAVDAEPFEVGVALHALRAEWVRQKGGSPDADIEKGLAMAENALVKDPHRARTFLAKGQLEHLRALTANHKAVRSDACEEAKKAIDQAFRENPFLKREYDRARFDADPVCR